MIWQLYKEIRLFVRQISDDQVSAHAAGTAFFLFLSMIPLLMLICAILPFTPVTEGMLMRFAVNLTPHSVDSFMVYLIGEVYDQSKGIVSVTAVVTVWIAAKGMLSLMRGLNAVNGIAEKRNYFLLRLEACLYTFCLLIILVGTLVILVFGNMIGNALMREMGAWMWLFKLLFPLRFFAGWIVLGLLFSAIYTYVPSDKKEMHRKFYKQIPGAVFAAVSWSGISWSFSLYIDRFNGFNMYGKLTAVIIMLLWLYFCMYLLLVGAKINGCINNKK